MLKVGDKVRVLHSGAVGVIQEILLDNKVCVEFDNCAGSRTTFDDYLVEAMPPGYNSTGNIGVIQGDKGL
jgi:hypothetical protein